MEKLFKVETSNSLNGNGVKYTVIGNNQEAGEYKMGEFDHSRTLGGFLDSLRAMELGPIQREAFKDDFCHLETETDEAIRGQINHSDRTLWFTLYIGGARSLITEKRREKTKSFICL